MLPGGYGTLKRPLAAAVLIAVRRLAVLLKSFDAVVGRATSSGTADDASATPPKPTPLAVRRTIAYTPRRRLPRWYSLRPTYARAYDDR